MSDTWGIIKNIAATTIANIAGGLKIVLAFGKYFKVPSWTERKSTPRYRSSSNTGAHIAPEIINVKSDVKLFPNPKLINSALASELTPEALLSKSNIK